MVAYLDRVEGVSSWDMMMKLSCKSAKKFTEGRSEYFPGYSTGNFTIAHGIIMEAGSSLADQLA